MVKRGLQLFSLMLLQAGRIAGQTPAAPSFEVASVRPSDADSAAGNAGSHSGNGQLTMRNVTLKRCVRGAYGVPEAEIFGGPPWVGEDRFDIVARAPGPAGDEELMSMLQTLLAERLRLILHRETRPVSLYVLTLGKGGVKAKASVPDTPSRTDSRRGRIDAKSCNMSQVALKISESLHVPVKNLTGKTGVFDFVLEWTPDDMREKAPSAVDTGPSIFSAVREQLGLRLESRRLPTEVLVILKTAVRH